MPELSRLVLVLHVLSAFAYIAGYVGTNLLTEIARRTDDFTTRRSALAFSTRFDRLLNAPGGGIVGLTGLLAVWAFGYSLLAPWILASIALWLILAGVGAVYWSRFGRAVEAALASGDESRVTMILRAPRNVIASRLENLVPLAIIVLMILRPGT